MKKIAMLAGTGLAAMFGFVSQAHAQDWKGFYWGGQVSYDHGKSEHSLAIGKVVDIPSATIKGEEIGVHAGHNWQNGDWVYGAELDGNWANTDGDVFVGKTLKTELNWTADARARVGYATGPVVLFGAAGLAVASGKLTVSSGPASVSTDADFVGWTAGLGADWALDPVWSLRGEWQHKDFGKGSNDVLEVTHDVKLDNFSVGFSRKF